jgi:uncharacterized protein CbrC (UPF0167 family)
MDTKSTERPAHHALHKMNDTMPTFRYHPEPLDTGCIIRSSAICRRCERARGYIYTGPVFAEEELDEALCPWCIADGSAAAAFDAEFTDRAAVGNYGRWQDVPPGVAEEIALRTPGFSGWQQELWWTHCGDGAAYLGRAGRAELHGRWAAAIPALRAEAQMTDESWPRYLNVLDANGSPTAYVFQCRHCGALGGYSDTD